MTDALVRARYAGRADELRGLAAQRGEAGRVLVAAGDLLRRSAAFPGEGAGAGAALSTLTKADVAAWIGGVDAARAGEALALAADQAVEAALAETERERGALE